jgi:ABC-type dipeptide/oligopeptide/nickel transport system permease component
METKANYTIVGIFTLIVIAANLLIDLAYSYFNPRLRAS